MRLLGGVLVVLAVLSLLASAAVRRGPTGGHDRPPFGRGLTTGVLVLGAFVLVVVAVVALRQG